MDSALIVTQELEKISSLTILNEEKRQELISAAPYTAIPYMPINFDFIKNYILNDTEYPLYESKLSQSAIELKARINRIVDAQFNIDKLQLEIKELEMDIEDIEREIVSDERKQLKKAKKSLEIKQKKWMITGYLNESETNFRELTQWKKSVEDCVEEIRKVDPSIQSYKDINYEAIRSAEMKVKIEIWKAQQAKGAQLTPSQLTLIRQQ